MEFCSDQFSITSMEKRNSATVNGSVAFGKEEGDSSAIDRDKNEAVNVETHVTDPGTIEASN